MRLFLSAPLTQFVVDLQEGRDTSGSDFRVEWESITAALEKSGHEIFSAHRREEWGTKLDPPDAALVADLGGLRWSEIVIAYVGDPPSPGVQLELGYALALERRLIIFIDVGQAEPYLIRGMPAAGRSEVFEISSPKEIGTVLTQKGLISTEYDSG
jgi:nucleoside 2-deoxyribosyltransferase